jgi:hypothetical protein
MTPQKRRMHLIDKHMYPKNFFFAVTRDGIDGKRSLLVESGHHRRRSSNNFNATKDQRRRNSLLEAGASLSANTNEKAPDPALPEKEGDAKQKPDSAVDSDMAELTGAMSALQFVPPSVRFGRGGGRAGFSKR